MKLGQPQPSHRSPDELRKAVVRRLGQMLGLHCEPFHTIVEHHAADWYEVTLLFATHRARNTTLEYLRLTPWATLVGQQCWPMARIRLNHLDLL